MRKRNCKEIKYMQKGTSGITIVALVVTIVVLIIIATITVNIVLNGGIVDKAQKAKILYENEEEKEQAIFQNVIERMNEIEAKGGKTEETPKPQINPNWKTADDLTEINYGDYVTNYDIDIDGDGKSEDDWRIFVIKDYKGEQYHLENYGGESLESEDLSTEDLPTEGKRVYLIASDYVRADTKELIEAVGEDNACMKSGTGNRADYAKFWDKSKVEYNCIVPGDNITSSDHYCSYPGLFDFCVLKKINAEQIEQNYNSAQKCASRLLCTDAWRSFTIKGFSNYAVGAPSIMMWADSWNDKHEKDESIVTWMNKDGSYSIAKRTGSTEELKPGTDITLERKR